MHYGLNFNVKTLKLHITLKNDYFLQTSFRGILCFIRASLVAPCKESTFNAGDMDQISESGRSSGEGNGNPLQYSCQGKSHGQRSLTGYSPWGCKGVEHDLGLNKSNKCFISADQQRSHQGVSWRKGQASNFYQVSHRGKLLHKDEVGAVDCAISQGCHGWGFHQPGMPAVGAGGCLGVFRIWISACYVWS